MMKSEKALYNKSDDFLSELLLDQQIARAKLHQLERTVGSNKYGEKLCEMYYVISGTNTFSSTVTCKIFKINQKLHCNDKCLVYLANCKMCDEQYTGQTIDSFRSRGK